MQSLSLYNQGAHIGYHLAALPKFKSKSMAIQLDTKPPTSKAMHWGPLSKYESSKKVKEIFSNGRWDFSKLSFEMPTNIKEKIHQIPNLLKNCNNDTHIWNMNTNGYFTNKSYLTIFKPTIKSHTDFMLIWKLNCPNKIRYFFW